MEPVRDFLGRWWGYMSCAIWTVLGLGVLVFNPTAKTQIKLYFIFALVSLFLALIHTIFKLHNENKKLRSAPPQIELVMEELAHYRSTGERYRWEHADLFVLATIELKQPPATKVDYALVVIRGGSEVRGDLVDDIERWDVVEDRYYKHLAREPREKFILDAKPLPSLLSVTDRTQGWLHFRFKGLRDSELSPSRLRFSATTPNGGAHFEKDLNTLTFFRRKYVIRPKAS